MARKDLQYGRRTIENILRALERPEGLEQKYAEATLALAVQNASGRPTPQAHMAAENMVAEAGSIYPLAGGPPADVSIGSEFGSTIYRQFHKPPNPRGYWLYPAANDTRTLAAGDGMLEEILQDAIRSAEVGI